MTCIVGIQHKGSVWIGGDSAGCAGLSMVLREDEKVFISGEFIYGFTSSFRMGQLIRYKFKAPKQKVSETDFGYLCTTYMDALIKCFKDNGFATVNNNSVEGGTFLVGYKGKLYEIEDDFQVGKSLVNYDSCGCGVNYALGALFITQDCEIKPKMRIELALDAASFFSTSVCGPYNILKLKPGARQ